jgi:hypothetical protein
MPGDGDEDGERGRRSEAPAPAAADATDRAASGSQATEGATERTAAEGDGVIVPLRLYKTVTVFATLIAVTGVLAGFVLLDAATDRGQAAPEEVDLLLALAGLAAIVLGAAVYAFSTRFRTRGMRKAQAGGNEGKENE